MPTPEEIAAAKKAAAKKAADEAARKKAASQEDDDDEDEDVEEDDELDSDDDDSDDDEGKGKRKGKGDDDEEGDDSEERELGFSEKQKAYLKKLRGENAKHRKEAKSLGDRFSKLESGLKGLFGGADDDKLSPEEKLKKITEEKEALAFNQSLAEAAIEYGVTKANLKYFKFLVAQKAEELKDGEELDENDLKKLAKEANGRSAPGGTSVNGKGNPPPDDEDGELSLEEFQGMGIGARSALYQKDKALYDKLVAKEREAKKKR